AVRVRDSQPATVVVNPRPGLAYNLVARYLFDTDGGGTTALDNAPFGPAKTAQHDGTNNGAVWVASVTDGKNVTRTGVMQFDPGLGVSQQIAIEPLADFNSPVGTIAFWMNCAPPASKAGLFDRRGGTNNYGDVLILNANSADSPNGIPDTIFDQCYPAGLNVGGTTAVDDSNWHHFAYVYTWLPFGMISFYVDGKLDAELTHGNAGAWPLDRQLEFGQSHDGYWPTYTGYMDDIHIFNRTLSAAEINQLMVSGVPALPPTLSTSVTNKQLTITWSQAGYILQQNGKVNNGAGWADISGATNGTYSVTLPATGDNFYRVRSFP
ncbi:MAG: LamG domain-containing protein, partial [Verrucomicrobia bacterium]|nr:LamG domain-containing protein [Verrucomicrobiota bacterium]